MARTWVRKIVKIAKQVNTPPVLVQMHAQIVHWDIHRRSGVCLAGHVGRVKQPEPTVHARHAKPVNIVRVPMLMLLHVSIALKVFFKPRKARVIVCRAFRKLVAVSGCLFLKMW